MINYKSLLTGLWVIMAAGGRVQAADNSAVLLHPDRYKAVAEIKGKIQAMDESSHRITVEDTSNQQVTVIVSSDTRFTDSDNHAFNWTSLRSGDSVVVYYKPKERAALQIDRQSTITESVFGTNRPATK